MPLGSPEVPDEIAIRNGESGLTSKISWSGVTDTPSNDNPANEINGTPESIMLLCPDTTHPAPNRRAAKALRSAGTAICNGNETAPS